jgi:hypothetical protein
MNPQFDDSEIAMFLGNFNGIGTPGSYHRGAGSTKIR